MEAIVNLQTLPHSADYAITRVGFNFSTDTNAPGKNRSIQPLLMITRATKSEKKNMPIAVIYRQVLY